MEGIPMQLLNGVASYSGFEDKFNNSPELMNLDMFDGWCNSPFVVTNQMELDDSFERVHLALIDTELRTPVHCLETRGLDVDQV
ncbi:hypothetical protein LguiA_017553 [Lonicera macranthoides]